jgi:SAM-dependent methyltransferase
VSGEYRVKYFKNTELAKIYNVSEKSVRNWIQSTQEGKLNLQLYQKGQKSFIANTAHNTTLVNQLVEKGKKYKNQRGIRVITPTPEFYETYDTKQIFDIISNITIRGELPLKYSYLDGGASLWDKFALRLFEEDSPNLINKSIELLDSRLNDIDRLIGSRKHVNVVDLGPGNGLPVRDILEHLSKAGKLKRYIAVDISQEILDITEKNIVDWFGDKIEFEGYIKDFDTERFDDLFADEYTGNDEDIPLNLVMLLGGTLCNSRSPDQTLQVLNSSLGVNDILFYTTKLDTPNSRRYFDFNISPGNEELTPRHRLILDFLNIDKSLYSVEQRFDEKKRARFIGIRPKIELSIQFEFSKGVRSVSIHKDKAILLWRYWHQDMISILRQFDKNDFDILQSIKSEDQEYLLLVLKIKTNQ